MKNILVCRRTFIAVLSIVCLTALGLLKDIDVAMSLASIAIGLAGSNAFEATAKSKSEFRKE